VKYESPFSFKFESVELPCSFICEYKFSVVHLVKQNLFTCGKNINIRDTFQDDRLYFCRFLFLTLLQRNRNV
jgi:hypothetical protein